MTLSSVKTEEQLSNGSILPKTQVVSIIDGQEFELYEVPLSDGSTAVLGLSEPGRESSVFVDLASGDEIHWAGRWRTLSPVLEIDPTFSNFEEAWDLRPWSLTVYRDFGFLSKI